MDIISFRSVRDVTYCCLFFTRVSVGLVYLPFFSEMVTMTYVLYRTCESVQQFALTTAEGLNGFSLNLILGIWTAVCGQNSVLFTIGQECKGQSFLRPKYFFGPKNILNMSCRGKWKKLLISFRGNKRKASKNKMIVRLCLKFRKFSFSYKIFVYLKYKFSYLWMDYKESSESRILNWSLNLQTLRLSILSRNLLSLGRYVVSSYDNFLESSVAGERVMGQPDLR
jgi:hypothetical protein